MCYVQDIYKGFINKEADDKQMLKVTRLSMIVLGVLALLIAMYYPNIIGLILWGYSFAVGGLLASVVMALYWKRTTNTGALASMFVGGGVHLYLTVTGFYIPAVLISAPLGFIVIVVVSLLTPKPDVEKYRIYFDDEYQKSIN
jgi:SSS family solute:Na+ symporter